MFFPGFSLFLLTYFLPCMLIFSRYFRCSSVSMASKREGSQDTDGVAIGTTVEQVSSSMPICEDTKLYLDKDAKLKWQEINEAFTSTFGEGLEDHQVYMNIHKFNLYWIACRYLAFPCTNMIHWIVSHTDPETMTLSSVSGTKLETF